VSILTNPTKEPTMEQLLTIKQVAELTQYSVVSINRFVKNGTIKAMRLPNGRKWMIEKKELENVLKYKNDNGEKFDL